MEKIRAIVVDDERHSRERILSLLTSYDRISVLDSCSNGKQAIASINEMQPDLIFLDIRLKDLTGFDVLKRLKNKQRPIVIFVTAYNEYAIKAFDFFAFDYLLKPFEDTRFQKSIHRVIEEIEFRREKSFDSRLSELLDYVENKEGHQTQKLSDLKLPIKHGSKIEFIEQEGIKYICASGYYAEIFTKDRKFLVREPLSNLIVKLQKEFIRIHRSTIINIVHIKELEYTLHGEIDVIMTDQESFRVSKSYKRDFQNLFNI